MDTKWVLVALLAATAAQGATKVGNGDDGADLEGGAPVTDGVLIEARDLAVKRLEALNVSGIAGLGQLLPEARGAKLVMAKEDVEARVLEDEGAFHVNLMGKVYARTFPESHAATRFFPAALKLDKDQLVALHIHEALHRALPESAREDEQAVAEITLAITSSDSNHDRVRHTVEKLVPEASAPVAANGGKPPEVEHFKTPSEIGYKYTLYQTGNSDSRFPIQAMHSVVSDLYPFGGMNAPFGFGIEASLVRDSKGSHMGPLGLSMKLRAWTIRDFAIGFWANASLNTLSADELRNSPFGRDVVSAGISMRKELKHLYVENRIGISFAGDASHHLGKVDYTYDYGHVWDVQVKAGARIWKFDLGLYGEVHLADHLRVSGGAFNYDSGRYRIVSGGPEVAFRTDDMVATVFGRFLVDATKGANFDYLGNLLGAGVAQGGVGASLGFFF